MKFIDRMKPIVQQAGDLVMDYFRQNVQIYRKKDQSTATEADLASEKFLKLELQRLIPGSGFVAEESGATQGNEYTWIIDPIDGTKNFSRGIPYFCINVALALHDELIAAVTYYPAMQEWYYAERGAGAWRNGIQLHLDKPHWDQKGGLVVISDYRSRHAQMLEAIKTACKPIVDVRFRVYGAAALDLAYVAAGSFDAVLFENLRWWDAAAGVLLVQEAGGSVQQYDGSIVNSSFKTLLAGHKDICSLILPVVRGSIRS